MKPSLQRVEQEKEFSLLSTYLVQSMFFTQFMFYT